MFVFLCAITSYTEQNKYIFLELFCPGLNVPLWQNNCPQQLQFVSWRCHKMSHYREKCDPFTFRADVHCKGIAVFGLVAAHSTRMILKIVLTEKSSWPANIAHKCIVMNGIYHPCPHVQVERTCTWLEQLCLVMEYTGASPDWTNSVCGRYKRDSWVLCGVGWIGGTIVGNGIADKCPLLSTLEPHCVLYCGAYVNCVLLLSMPVCI